jgi:hypothetical protein
VTVAKAEGGTDRQQGDKVRCCSANLSVVGGWSRGAAKLMSVGAPGGRTGGRDPPDYRIVMRQGGGQPPPATKSDAPPATVVAQAPWRRASDSEVITDRAKRTQEPRGILRRFEAAHQALMLSRRLV